MIRRFAVSVALCSLTCSCARDPELVVIREVDPKFSVHSDFIKTKHSINESVPRVELQAAVLVLPNGRLDIPMLKNRRDLPEEIRKQIKPTGSSEIHGELARLYPNHRLITFPVIIIPKEVTSSIQISEPRYPIPVNCKVRPFNVTTGGCSVALIIQDGAAKFIDRDYQLIAPLINDSIAKLELESPVLKYYQGIDGTGDAVLYVCLESVE